MKFSIAERREMVVKDGRVSIAEQCVLLSIHRSGFYYVGTGESDENLEAMRLMDVWFLEHPHSGAITMCMYLCLDKGFTINIKRVRRLMRLMGLMAVYPKKKLTIAGEGHNIYPYLLRGLKIDRKNQVWATDITYVPMKKGFMYMMAVIDVKTRFILNWSISNTMDGDWCKTVLEETIALHGCPEIFNTDQMDGGRLSINSNGRVSAAWKRNGDVFYWSQNQPEQKLGTGRDVSMAVNKGNTLVAWQENNTIRIMDVAKK